MSGSGKIDRMRLRQLQAIAENLYTQGNHHRERKNYAIAEALYRNALAAAQKLDTPEYGNSGRSLVVEIQKDRQAVLELLQRSGSGAEQSALKEAHRVGDKPCVPAKGAKTREEICSKAGEEE